MTPAELQCIYAGPASLGLVVEAVLHPLTIYNVAYSYDTILSKYRWTLSRPLCEGKDRFITRMEQLMQAHEGLGIGIVFNGVKSAPKNAKLRAIWLPDCEDLHEALSSGPSGAVMDVVAGVCNTPEEWKTPPAFPTGKVEY